MCEAKSTRRASRMRRFLLIVGMVYVVLAVTWMLLPYFMEDSSSDFLAAGLLGTPLLVEPPGASAPEYYLINALLVLGLLVIAQWAFLRPGPQLSSGLNAGGRPMRSAVLSAAFMAMLLTVGAFALFMEIINRWAPDPNKRPAFTVAPGIQLGMLVGWVIWSAVFFVYWRQGDRYTKLGRMIRVLVAGSLLEALVAIPVHIWAIRQRECYCARGTYTTMVLAGTVLLWAFGPGIVLLYLREKHRRARLLFPKCAKCDYDLRGGHERCPECGTLVPHFD